MEYLAEEILGPGKGDDGAVSSQTAASGPSNRSSGSVDEGTVAQARRPSFAERLRNTAATMNAASKARYDERRPIESRIAVL